MCSIGEGLPSLGNEAVHTDLLTGDDDPVRAAFAQGFAGRSTGHPHFPFWRHDESQSQRGIMRSPLLEGLSHLAQPITTTGNWSSI